MKLCLFFLLALASDLLSERLHHGRESASLGCLPAVFLSHKVVLGQQTDKVLTTHLCSFLRGLKLFLSEHVSVLGNMEKLVQIKILVNVGLKFAKLQISLTVDTCLSYGQRVQNVSVLIAFLYMKARS